jgi:hypothetical protein
MKLISSRFNFNSTLVSILDGAPDGVNREHLIDSRGGEKNQLLLNYAYSIENILKTQVFLSVKYPFRSRDTRIEFVFLLHDNCYLCKLTSSKKIDQAGLQLQQIISSTSLDKKYCDLIGLVIFEGSTEKIISENFIESHLPNVVFESAENIQSWKADFNLSSRKK